MVIHSYSQKGFYKCQDIIPFLEFHCMIILRTNSTHSVFSESIPVTGTTGPREEAWLTTCFQGKQMLELPFAWRPPANRTESLNNEHIEILHIRYVSRLLYILSGYFATFDYLRLPVRVNCEPEYYILCTQQDSSLKLNILFLITFLVFCYHSSDFNCAIFSWMWWCCAAVKMNKKKGWKKLLKKALRGRRWMWKEMLLTQFRKCYLLLLLSLPIVLGCSSSLPRRKDPLCLENVKYGTHQLIISRSYLTSINPII